MFNRYEYLCAGFLVDISSQWFLKFSSDAWKKFQEELPDFCRLGTWPCTVFPGQRRTPLTTALEGVHCIICLPGTPVRWWALKWRGHSVHFQQHLDEEVKIDVLDQSLAWALIPRVQPRSFCLVPLNSQSLKVWSERSLLSYVFWVTSKCGIDP